MDLFCLKVPAFGISVWNRRLPQQTIQKYKQNQQKSILEPCREQFRQLLKQIQEGGCMTQKSGSPLNPKDQLLYVPHTKFNQINGLSIIVATDT